MPEENYEGEMNDYFSFMVKQQNLFNAAENAGSEVSYRCIKCRECKNCTNNDHIDNVSIKEEIEQDLINESVKVDIGNRCAIAKLPFIHNPSKKLAHNKENALKSGIVAQKDADLVVPYIDIHLKGDVLFKNRLLMLDVLANNNWERPIYFTGGSYGDDDFLWMKDYLLLDGVTYKLVPILTKVDRRNPFEMGRVDTDLMYKNVTSWDWGNSNDPDIYHDPETRRNAITYRSNLARLIEA